MIISGTGILRFSYKTEANKIQRRIDMKKKLISLLLIAAIVLSGCGGTKDPATNSNANPDTSAAALETTSENPQEETTEAMSDLEAIGDIKVEQELFDVTITVPADFVGTITQEELDAKSVENGYKATLNDDGSVTYVMTKKQHTQMMDDISKSLNDSLAEMVGSEDYPNITAITANADFTKFTVTTKNTEPDFAESFAVIAFYTYGGMYHIFNGTTVDNILVEYVNADSGEVISTANSKDME